MTLRSLLQAAPPAPGTPRPQAGQAQRPEVAFAVLRELGVLFQAPGASEAEDQPVPEPCGEHVFHDHAPLWAYEQPHIAEACEDVLGHKLYETLPPGTPPERALEHTRLVVLLGAEDTPALRAVLRHPGALALIFEPNRHRLARFAKSFPAASLANKAVILLGQPRDFLPPLSLLLPPDIFHLGFPVFYGLPTLLAEDPQGAADMVETVELLFFRHRVYPVSGQSNQRGLPLRNIAKGLFFDQQLHAYQNIPEFASCPDISHLRGAFREETAILVAAGPDLADKLDYLRGQRDHALVIAVNNALKPLLAAGIRPHFVVSNDTSLATERSWLGLPALPDVTLVAHCLTNLGRGVFGRTYLFGNFMPELFGTRPNLRLHGSVITTAYSLARHMGVARCVLVGAQLCSRDPWQMSYASGSVHHAPDSDPRPLTNAFPQLYPVRNPLTPGLYTHLNFLDAASWLLDEIRTGPLPCVNTTPDSLIHGPGVAYHPGPEVTPTGRLARRLGRLSAMRQTPRDIPRIAQALRAEAASWRAMAEACSTMLAMLPQDRPGFSAAAMRAVEQFDSGGVSYLLQRFEGFDHPSFHKAVFQPPDMDWARALGGEDWEAIRRTFLKHFVTKAGEMAGVFAATIERQTARLDRLAKPARQDDPVR